MLTALRNLDSLKVIARDSEKPEAPFSCPKCRREVVLHKGRIKVHHFAHKPPITCSLGQGESELHFRAKTEIFDALRLAPNASEVELERDCGASVADVYAVISGTRVAIEIQRSTLSVNDIVARTQNYHRLGIAVLWLALPHPDLDSDQYSPDAWEKWCHGAYFGRVYYWGGGEAIRPVHFGEYAIEVASRSWFADGYEQSAGGYSRRSKRWRTPDEGATVLLSQNFQRSSRSAWTGGTVSVPQCTLFVDRQAKWW